MQTLELTDTEPAMLENLLEREGRIERAQRNAYYEIGLELKAIRDSGLYKIQRGEKIAGRYSFTTFEEYCDGRWEMEYRRVKQLIDAAEAVEKLNNCSTFLPSRESHVRALLALESDDDRAKVWEAVATSGESVTAKYIEEQVERFNANKAKNWTTLDEWEALEDADRAALLAIRGDKTFNAQEGDSIEWARWSWNPITGCRHGCKYCYARDIAARFYPQGFKPTIIPDRLDAPHNTKPKTPQANWTDVDHMGYKNVFVCSMADLFGKWVPAEWIEAVLSRVRANPQWNFLFLTKFPTRMAEFDFPNNAWVGASVDSQGAVARAEKAFSKISAGVTWLSCEPMMERLTFNSLEMFDWVVIGGSSASVEHKGKPGIDDSPATPEFRPPFEWISHLYDQAVKSKCKVYMKTNLLERVREYPI